MIKLVSLDVWNTLLDIDVMLEAIAKEVDSLTSKGFDFALATIYSVRREIKALRREKKVPMDKVLSFSQDMLAETLGVDVETIKKSIARAVLNVPDRKLVKDSAEEVLKELKKKGYVVVVLGNVMFWPSSYTRLLLEKTGLADYIDKQYYSDEINSYKPMPDVFHRPLKDFNVSPDEAVHVGDSVKEDYEGALEAGLYAILIDENMDSEIMKPSERGFIIKDLKYLPKVLELVR